jgi:hypothetical protein
MDCTRIRLPDAAKHHPQADQQSVGDIFALRALDPRTQHIPVTDYHLKFCTATPAWNTPAPHPAPAIQLQKPAQK